MSYQFKLVKKPISTLVSGACLLMASGAVHGAACPAPSGGQILVDNQTVTATCTVPNLQSIVVTSTGAISTSYPNPAILIPGGIDMQAINNSGTVQSTGNALQVQGTVASTSLITTLSPPPASPPARFPKASGSTWPAWKAPSSTTPAPASPPPTATPST